MEMVFHLRLAHNTQVEKRLKSTVHVDQMSVGKMVFDPKTWNIFLSFVKLMCISLNWPNGFRSKVTKPSKITKKVKRNKESNIFR